MSPDVGAVKTAAAAAAWDLFVHWPSGLSWAESELERGRCVGANVLPRKALGKCWRVLAQKGNPFLSWRKETIQIAVSICSASVPLLQIVINLVSLLQGRYYPILWTWKLRFREGKGLAQDHRMSRCHGWEWNPGVLTPTYSP